MKTLEVRRHSYTKKDRTSGSYLSPRGVALARTIGTKTGPFDLVIASPFPRTSETAIAMGFAVDDIVDVGIDDGFWAEVSGGASPGVDHWDVYTRAISGKGKVARVAQAQKAAWLEALASLPDGGSVLFVSHGDAVEVGLAACFGDRNLSEIGAKFRQLEGFRSPCEGGSFGDLQIMRITEVGE